LRRENLNNSSFHATAGSAPASAPCGRGETGGLTACPFLEVPRRRGPMVTEESGGLRMSDARALLTRISALRQRLEHAQGLLHQASSAADPDTPDRLERDVADGTRAQAPLDSSLRQIAGALTEEIIRPTQLTARARRALEKGYELVGRLRQLGGDPIVSGADADDPLPLGVRAAAAMTETAV